MVTWIRDLFYRVFHCKVDHEYIHHAGAEDNIFPAEAHENNFKGRSGYVVELGEIVDSVAIEKIEITLEELFWEFEVVLSINDEICRNLPPDIHAVVLAGNRFENGKIFGALLYRTSDLKCFLAEELEETLVVAWYQVKDAKEAFDIECKIYHLFGKLSGWCHPTRPFVCGWSCPGCGIFNPGV